MHFGFLFDLAIIVLIILVNSFFVLSEIAIIASRKAKLKSMVLDNNKGAQRVLDLMNHPESFISTVQVGITLMSILMGLYSGASFSGDLAKLLAKVPFLAPYSEAISYFLVVFCITYFAILGEIIPKRLALYSPEAIGSKVSASMLWLYKLVYPFVFLLELSAKLFFKLFRFENVASNEVTTEEIKLIINQAREEGTFAQTERDLLNRVISFAGMEVGAIMTPRTQLVYLDIRDSQEENIEKIKGNVFSYFPVVDGGLENIKGIVHVKDLLLGLGQKGEVNLLDHVFEPLYTGEMASLTKLLTLLKERKVRVSIVLDEYGGVEGIVTLNDIFKAMVGDLPTLANGQQANIVANSEDGSYIIAGNLLIEELKELIGVTALPDEEEENYRTIASYMLKELNDVPKLGDHFTAMGWYFEVVKVDGMRIDRVLLKKV